MNRNELVKELIERMKRYGYFETRTHVKMFIQEYEALTKDEKPIKLKDVIKRIKELNDGTRFDWEYKILQELGSDFGSKMFHEAYQQGRFDEGIEAHYGREKVKIPQFVADVIECAREQSAELEDAFEYARDAAFRGELGEWFMKLENRNTFARAWLDGYELEEKRYLVKMRGLWEKCNTLNRFKNTNEFIVSESEENNLYKTKFTRKELEEAGFGWVFDCPGIEVEEVE